MPLASDGEVFRTSFLQKIDGHLLLRILGVYQNQHWVGHTDGIKQVELRTLAGSDRGHEIFSNVPSHVLDANRSTFVGSFPENAPPPWLRGLRRSRR